jgi:hypothetical protein
MFMVYMFMVYMFMVYAALSRRFVLLFPHTLEPISVYATPSTVYLPPSTVSTPTQ